MCHTIVAVRWLISSTQTVWTDPLSPSYWSYCKQAETIFQGIKKKSKRSKIELQQLSLALGFNFLPSCLKAITVGSCQNRHGTHCIHGLCSSRRPHHSISNGARLLLPHPLAGFSPSFHTTSGAVGPAPSSGGGLCRCTLQHISEKDPPQDEDGLRWQVPASEQPEMFVMH